MVAPRGIQTNEAGPKERNLVTAVPTEWAGMRFITGSQENAILKGCCEEFIRWYMTEIHDKCLPLSPLPLILLFA